MPSFVEKIGMIIGSLYIEAMKRKWEAEVEQAKHTAALPGKPANVVVDAGTAWVNGKKIPIPDGEIVTISPQGIIMSGGLFS